MEERADGQRPGAAHAARGQARVAAHCRGGAGAEQAGLTGGRVNQLPAPVPQRARYQPGSGWRSLPSRHALAGGNGARGGVGRKLAHIRIARGVQLAQSSLLQTGEVGASAQRPGMRLGRALSG